MAVLLICSCSFLPITENCRRTEAASLGQQLLYSVAAMALVNAYYNNLDEHGQSEMLKSSKQKTGFGTGGWQLRDRKSVV